METCVKYGGTGLSLLVNQLKHNAVNFDYLDPITTIVKIGLVGHKNLGTKLGLHNHMILIQEPGMYQSIQRFFNGDDRNQLYQLRYPIIYFHGLALGLVEESTHQENLAFYQYLEEKAITGLKRLKTTYENNSNVGSITTTCIDTYIEILSEKYSMEDYNKYVHDVMSPMIMSIYQDYMKKWTCDDFRIIEQISKSIEKKTDKKTQNGLCETLDSYLNTKNTEIATVRPV
jgi:hypothetical protein